MKKMIDQEKINKSDALFEGMTADANGNVTVGKNLEIDGKVILNTADDLEIKDGSGFTKNRTILKEGKDLTEENIKELNKNLFFEMTGSDGTYYLPLGVFQNSSYSQEAFMVEFTDAIHFRTCKMSWSLHDKKFISETKHDYIISADSASKKIGIPDLKRGIMAYGYLIPDKNNYGKESVLAITRNGEFFWKEQEQYYNHDVKIMFNNSPLFLSIITTSNAPIDSVTDLKTACGSRTRIPMSGGFAGTGSVIQFACAYLPQENKLQLYSGNTISVGGTTVLLTTGDGNTLGAITDDITTL